jgi:DNA-binding protein HU-beta
MGFDAFCAKKTGFWLTIPQIGVDWALVLHRKEHFMNKNELVAVVADKAGLTKAQAGDALDATLEAITAALKGGDEVRLLGFGNFVVAKRAATTARNPQTGATVNVPASNAPKFKPGKALKDAVN